ncbi:AMP-binding protein [Streptomyces finlayi]|uniref:AMP-binding protein n=1 Tax=Streptomyces finlayi TaxID=67296 RepID=UPI0021560F32|nr:AMP-binding protein [Streptomyces finlayi]
MPFVRNLTVHGDRPALITPDGELTYRELAAQVEDTARRLGSRPRLVLLAGANSPQALVHYLAALSAGHPLLLVPGSSEEAVRSLTAAYDPDVVVRPAADGRWTMDERRKVSNHTFHPDLALLLSTSGSTGSPKLVRLSRENLQSNAAAIASYLGIRETDRAATTLPMHYCYGLSVVNSHLMSGAGLILTGLSVADTCFWDLFRTARGSSLAAVPYTFELLDRVGFADMDLPHLRYVTQAGGRLAPEKVRRYAELGRRGGWDLFVMYGQTEATARMAYLPPDLALTHPQTIGVPVPGGSFRIDPVEDETAGTLPPGTGELVYCGSNVMLGYADSPADLSLGRTVQELRTGDLARRTPEGLYEVVGRRSRFAKILGVRIDPQRVEELLARQGVAAYCVGGDDELLVGTVAAAGEAAEDGAAGQDEDVRARRIRRLVAEECALPTRSVRVLFLPELPRLATGKPDHEALRRAAGREGPVTGTSTTPAPAAVASAGGRSEPADLLALYAEILDIPRGDVTEDSSFVSLGGDSLGYVEMSIRLEEALGQLPQGWHVLPVGELTRMTAASKPRRARALHALETGVLLRAVSIILIVAGHIPLFLVQGGAHTLLGVAGFNFARFLLTDAPRRVRVRNIWRSTLRVVVPSVVWITAALFVFGEYHVPHAFLVSSVMGPFGDRTTFHFWFLESLVYFLLVAAALLAVPAVHRAERRFPFALPMALAGVGLVTRYELFGLDIAAHFLKPVGVFWLIALGWAAARATDIPRRLLVTAAVAATVHDLFPGAQTQREILVIIGLALLVWVPSIPSLPLVNRIAGVLAGASLYIYLTHFMIYPHFDSPVVGLLASLAVGIAYGASVNRTARAFRRRSRARRTARCEGRVGP